MSHIFQLILHSRALKILTLALWLRFRFLPSIMKNQF